MRVLIALAVVFMLLPVPALVAASDMTRQTISSGAITIPGAMEQYANETVDLNSTTAQTYENFYYTDMDALWGLDGKYIAPLTPPVSFMENATSTACAYASRFSVTQAIFGGISDCWIRQPFTYKHYPSAAALAPDPTTLHTGNYTVRVYRIIDDSWNITSVPLTGILTGDKVELKHYQVIEGTYTGSAEDWYRLQSLPNQGDFKIYAVWLRLSAMLNPAEEYIITVRNVPNSAQTLNWMLTEGDAWADGRTEMSWIHSANIDAYIGCDLDIAVYAQDFYSMGVGAVQGTTTVSYIMFTDDTYTTAAGDYINILFPISVDNDEVDVEIFADYTIGTQTWTTTTDTINGEGYINLSYNPTDGKIMQLLRITVSTDSGQDMVLWYCDDVNGQRACAASTYASLITDTTGERRHSSATLYGYFALDTWQTTMTDPFIPVPIGFNGQADPQANLDLISEFSCRLVARDDWNLRMETYELFMTGTLELLFALAFFPAKILDMAIEGAIVLVSTVADVLEDTALAGLVGWIRRAVAFIIDTAEWVANYGMYVLHQICRALLLVYGWMISAMFINWTDSAAKYIFKESTIDELHDRFEETTRLLTIPLVLLSIIINIILGLVEMVVPL